VDPRLETTAEAHQVILVVPDLEMFISLVRQCWFAGSITRSMPLLLSSPSMEFWKQPALGRFSAPIGAVPGELSFGKC
jgi:hypothetical protein